MNDLLTTQGGLVDVASSAPETPLPNVLLVDDQPARLLTYEALLDGVGVRCVRAHSGTEALQKLLVEEFATIVLDVQMPEMDGFETARHIRGHPRFERTPIIFVTGVNVSELDRLRGYEVGAIDYIPLPIVPEIFRSKIALLVELYSRRAELKKLNRHLETARSQLEGERNDAILQSRSLQKQASDQGDWIRASLRLGEKFRSLTEPADIAFAAAEILCETLAVSRCGYGTIDHAAETITIERDWNAPGIRSLAGVLHFRDYGTYIDELKRGETVICTNAALDPRTSATAAALRSIQVQSFVNMPIIEQQGTVALLYLNHEHPRQWSDEELAFIRDIAERTRVAVERRRNERALAAELECMGCLRNLSARLVAEENPETLFGEVLAAATFITAADRGTVQLFDAAANELVLAAAQGFEESLLERFSRVGPSTGSSCGLALAARKRVFIGLDEGEPDPDGSRALLRSSGLRCAQSTPLVSRSGEIIGMFSTHWFEKRVLTEREDRFLDLLARQAADLIERQAIDQSMREADRRKDEFIAMLSHELRNPLVPIRNGITLLKKAPDPEGIIAKIQPMMERQMAHTVRLVDDLLDVSRVTSGRIELIRAPATLDSIIAVAIEAQRPKMDLRELKLEVRVEDPGRQVNVDAPRLTQAVSNLLSNAVKFSPTGARVELRARISPAVAGLPYLLVSIRDYGIGIRPEELSRIFELFASIPGAANSRSSRSGLGVGLALARKIVELHGGSLQAFSEGIGLGSEFVIRIPVPDSAETLVRSREPSAPLPVNLRVLVVDDNTDGANSMVMLLQSLGMAAEAVYDGEAAIASVENQRYSIVVLDIGMPGMDGFEVCRRLREKFGNSLIIIALTGWGQERDKLRVVEAGFDSHLTKPVDAKSLADAIRALSAQPA